MPPLGFPKVASYAALWACLLASPVGASPEDDYQRGLAAYNKDELIDAMGWLEQASAAGHPKAQALLAYILDKAEENAARSLELFRPLYREGRQSVLEVIRAEEALAKSRTAKMDALLGLHLTYARLMAASGQLNEAAVAAIASSLKETRP